MKQEYYINLKENWYWIGPIIGGFLATMSSFAKERVEEWILERRFKKNILSMIVEKFSSIINAWEDIDAENIKLTIKDMLPIISKLENDFSSLSVKYASKHYKFITKTHDELKFLNNFLTSESISDEQVKEYLQKTKSVTLKNSSAYNNNAIYRRLNESYIFFYTSIHAFK